MTASQPKQKALVVATRCVTAEQFVSTFHKFCDEQSFFVATLASRPVGLETAFSIQLQDKTPVLRGLCTVVEAWATPANRFGRPGVRLAVKRLTKESLAVFEQLQVARKAADAAPPQRKADAAAPEAVGADVDLTNPIASETRAPGSSYVLPANPLMNLTDQSLEGFVDCALYEETGNFFRAAEDDASHLELEDAADAPRPSTRTLTPIPALRPTAFVPPDPDDREFAPEHTPLPQLAGIVPARAATPPPVPATPPAGRAPTPPPFESGAQMFGARPVGYGAEPPAAAQPMPAAMQPRRSLDRTDNLIAIGRQRERKRFLVIAGTAAGVSLLLLVIGLAVGGDRDERAAASTPEAADTPSSPAPKPPVTEAVASKPPPAELPGEPTGDPNAPPVVGSGPCRVTVTSSPAGSMVHVDDRSIGPSPITIAGPCTKWKIHVKHPRYALRTRWVTPTEGEPSSVDLALARPTHTVMVTSTPPGATVSIAGRRAGTTPTSVKVMGFTGVKLTVEKRGFKTVTQRLYSKVDRGSVKVTLVRGR